MDRPHIVTEHLGAALWVVRLEGEHDLATAPRIRQTIDEIYRTGTCLIVDLSDATFVDSSILVELIRANEHADATPDERLAVVAPPGSPAGRLFDVAGADETWFRRFGSTPTAIAWCNGEPEPAGSDGHADRATVAERTEQVFQGYNERRVALEAIAGASEAEPVPFACECDDPACGGAVELTLAEYEQATDKPDEFVVKPGHEDLSVELVVAEHPGYVVVSKPRLREPSRR